MSWTVTDDDNDGHDVLQVRATIMNQEELRALIAALEKRLTKENPDV